MTGETSNRTRAEEDARLENERRARGQVREILDLERSRQSDYRNHDHWMQHNFSIHRKLTTAMFAVMVVEALAIVAASAKYVLGF